MAQTKNCIVFHESQSFFTSVWPEQGGTIEDFGAWVLANMYKAGEACAPYPPRIELVVGGMDQKHIDTIEVEEFLRSCE